MSYASALDRLYALGQELHTAPGTPRRKFELAHMRTLMASLGNASATLLRCSLPAPTEKVQRRPLWPVSWPVPAIRLAFTPPPHLNRVNERIQVNGSLIGDDDFAALFFMSRRLRRPWYGTAGCPRYRVFLRRLRRWAFCISLPPGAYRRGGSRYGRPVGCDQYRRACDLSDY